MNLGKNTARALVAMALATIAVAVASCAGELEGTEINACPSKEIFQESVSPYMERRCGTLDCHGGIARPMRLYGQLGLRHPDEANIVGGKPTTQLELDANYSTVCTLDPEKMNESVQDLGNSAEELLLIHKARGIEKHKGGIVVTEGDHGDQCLLVWLRGDKKEAPLVASECAAAIEPLK